MISKLFESFEMRCAAVVGIPSKCSFASLSQSHASHYPTSLGADPSVESGPTIMMRDPVLNHTELAMILRPPVNESQKLRTATGALIARGKECHGALELPGKREKGRGMQARGWSGPH